MISLDYSIYPNTIQESGPGTLRECNEAVTEEAL
jgi:hypothetical protein